MFIYHSTPYTFDTLKEGSWVSSSSKEAALHLFMKTMDHKGWIIKVPCEDHCLTNHLFVSENCVNSQTSLDILIHDQNRMRFSDYIDTLSGIDRAIFFPVENIDLRHLIGS